MISARVGRGSCNGISLIEVLTIIAVIAILAGILLPVFVSVRESTRISICQANLKQLAVAFEMYLDDWNNRYPVPGGLPGNRNYWAQENGSGIQAYLRSPEKETGSVWVCPSFSGEWNSPFTPRTYGMNTYLRAHNPLPEYLNWPWYHIIYISKGLPRRLPKDPANTILLYEGIPRNDYFEGHQDEGYVGRCGDWTQVRGYYPDPLPYYQDAHKAWHRGRNAYLMCDGHVLMMKPEKYESFRFPSPEQNRWFVERFR